MTNNTEVLNWSLSDETNPLGLSGLGVFNLNGTSKSTQYNVTTPTPILNPYENLFYKDLDLDTTKPYTINVTMDYLKTIHNDFSKNLNFFTFGQHIAGENCGVFTVGTDTTTGTLKPVLGVIGKTVEDTKKATPIVNAIDLDNLTDTDQVKFTITFNPLESGEDRLILFVNDIKQCNAEGLGINHYNYVVTRPRLYFLYSGWTNEVGWNNLFDYSAQRLLNVEIHNVAMYPASYYITKFQSVALELDASLPDFNVASFKNQSKVQVVMTNSVDIGKKVLKIVGDTYMIELTPTQFGIDNKEVFEGTIPDGFPSGYLSGNTVKLFLDGNELPNVLTLPTSSKYFVDHTPPSLNVNGKSTLGITFDKQEGQEVHFTFQYIQDNTIEFDIQIVGNEINATNMQTAILASSLLNNNPIQIDLFAIRADNYQDTETVNDYVTNFIAQADMATVPKTSVLVKNNGLYDITGTTIVNQLKITSFLEVDRFYTGYYFIIAQATDKSGNLSEYIQVEVPVTNLITVVDQITPEISIYELEESPENFTPGVLIKGHAFDEASYFDVYAVIVKNSDSGLFTLDETLKDFLVNNAQDTKLLNDQPATQGTETSNLGYSNNDTRLSKYWNGTQFVNIELDNTYTAFAMCIEDSGKFNYNIDKYDGFVSVDQSVSAFNVGAATVSANDIQTTLHDGNTIHIVKPGVTLEFTWTMDYSGSQDTDFELSFNGVNMTVIAVDQYNFKSSFTISDTTPREEDGQLLFSLKYLPTQTVSTPTQKVFLELLEVTNDFNVAAEIDGTNYEHTTLKVENIIGAIPKSTLKNMGVYFGFSFNVELSATTGSDTPIVHVFNDVSFDANSTTSFNGFSKDISLHTFTGLTESTDYDVTLKLESNGQSASFTKTQNTGVDVPKINLVNSDAVLSTSGVMSIDVSGVTVSDASGTATLYAFLVDNDSNPYTLNSAVFANNIESITGVKVVSGDAPVTLTTYFSVQGDTLMNANELHPFYQNYKVVYFAKDNKNNLAIAVVTPPAFTTLDISNVVMTSTNTTNSSFLKHNNTFTVTWDTKYDSLVEHFSVFVFNIPSLVVQISDTQFTASMTVPSYLSTNGHIKDFLSVNYLGQSVDTFFAAAGKTIYVDVVTPTLTFNIENSRPTLYHKRIQFTDVQLTDASEKNFLTSESGTFENYEFKFNAKDKVTKELNQLVVTSPSVSDYNNFKYKSIENLDISTTYEVWMEVKDPAGNQHITTVSDFTTYHTEVEDLYVDTKTKSVSGVPEYTITGHGFHSVNTLDVFAFVTKTTELTNATIMQACMDITTNQRANLLLLTNSDARNAVDSAWTKQFTSAYKADGSLEPIVTDTSYVVHVVSRQVNGGVVSTNVNDMTVYTTELPSFLQSVVSSTFKSNMTNQTIAKENAVVTAVINTLYKEEDASRFNMEYVFESSTPNDVELEITASNGTNTQWTATYTVDSNTPNGDLNFILNIVAEYTVDLVSSSQTVVVQKDLDLTSVAITQFDSTSFTIGSDGQSVVDLLFADKTSYTYNNYFNFTMNVTSTDDVGFSSNVLLLNKTNTQVPSKFNFTNLKEGATYSVDFTIEDTVLGFSSQSLSNSVTLLKDEPTITSVVVTQQNVDGNLIIQASGKFVDLSSSFNAYVGVFNAPLPVNFDFVQFYQTSGEGTQVATDSAAGVVVNASDLQLNEFYNTTTLVKQTMTTSITTYYVNYFVVDSAVSPANTATFTKSISLNVDNYLVSSSLQIVNDTVSGSQYAKEGDSLTLSWVTNYVSTPQTFIAKLFTTDGEVVTTAVDVPVQGVDEKHWSITKTVPASYNGYAKFIIAVNDAIFTEINPSNNVYIDTTKPNITNLVLGSTTSKSIGLKQLEFDDVSSRSFDRNGYTLTLTATNTRTDGVTVATAQQTFTLDQYYAEKVFVIGSLQSGDTYTVTATITDLVGNVSDVYNARRVATPDEFQFSLVDEEKPIIESTVTLSYVQGGLKIEDIAAHDRHNTFNLVGALYREDPTHTFDEMEFMMYVKANLSMDGVEVINGLTHSNLDEANAALQELTFKQAIYYAGDPSTTENLVNGRTYKYCLFGVDANGNTSACIAGTKLYNDVTYYEPLGSVDIIGTVPMETKINPDSGNYDIYAETGVVGNTYNVDITKSEVDSTTTYIMNDTTSTNTDVDGDVTGSVINFPTTSPLEGLTDWSWVTSVSASNVTSDITLLYADANHYVKVKANGDVEMVWGGTTPVTTTNVFDDSGANDLGIVVNGSTGELSITLNGVTTTATEQTVTPQASTQLFLSNSGNETVTINQDIEFVARSITEEEIVAVSATTGRVLEYNFNTFENNQFTNELLMELPLVMNGANNNDIALETVYPRDGVGACKFVTNVRHLSVDLTQDEFFVNNGVPQTNMTSAFYYFNPAGMTENHLMRYVFGTKKLALKVSPTAMTLTDENSVTASVSFTESLSDDKWYFLAFTTSVSGITFYLDSAQVGDVQSTITLADDKMTSIVFGEGLTSTDKVTVNTRFDKFRLYDLAITQAKLASIALNPLEVGMLLRFDFEVTDATQVFDESTNTNHATIYNADTVSDDTSPISTTYLTLDGVDGYLDVAYKNSFEAGNLTRSTFTAWVNNKNEANVHSIEPLMFKANAYEFGVDYDGSTDKTKGVPIFKMFDSTTNQFVETGSLVPIEAPVKEPQADRDVDYVKDANEIQVANLQTAAAGDSVFIYTDSGTQPKPIDLGDNAITHYVDGTEFTGLNDTNTSQYSVSTWFKIKS